MRLFRVVSHYFVAGYEATTKVQRCAPILRKHLQGKTCDEAFNYCIRQGWQVQELK